MKCIKFCGALSSVALIIVLIIWSAIASAQTTCPPVSTISTPLSAGTTYRSSANATISSISTLGGNTTTMVTSGQFVEFLPGAEISLAGSGSYFQAQIQSCLSGLGCLVDNCSDSSIWLKTNNWHWVSNGKASAAPYWNTRQAIKSKSPSDGSFALYFQDTLNTHNDTLTSRVYYGLAPDSMGKVYVRFHEYYRSMGGVTTLEFSVNGGSWNAYFPNTEIQKYYETVRHKQVIVPITVAGISDIQIRFVSSGKTFFWIVDDINVCEEYPSPTLPNPAFGKYLYSKGYDYEVDSLGHPYVRNQTIVQFSNTATLFQKDSIRNDNNVLCFVTCLCDSLELWNISCPIFNGDGSSATLIYTESGPGGGSKPVASAAIKKDGGINYLLWDGEPQRPQQSPCPPNTGMPVRVSLDTANTTIAILDSGINSKISNRYPVFANPNPSDLNDCLPNDTVGYNFIDIDPTNCQLRSNSPIDDESHGSHVAGILASTLDALNVPNSTYRLLPIKVLDKNGVGTAFSGACGIYYAASKNSKLINCSWGFYGGATMDTTALAQSLIYARSKGATVVCSAGNDKSEISALNVHLPSSYELENVVAVAAHDTNGDGLAAFSNYSRDYVDISAPGVDILSYNCNASQVRDSGTSMATPYATAILFKHFQGGFALSAFLSNLSTLGSNCNTCETRIPCRLEITEDGNWTCD